ncbi:MAG: glycosyltransferase [Candidatus Competibacteraceae bacterium]
MTVVNIDSTTQPRLVVFSSLFPSPVQPNAGLFIRERMFRVAQWIPLVVVAPQPWFPFQSLIRWFRPHFRPMAPRYEIQQGIEVYHPRFLCFPGIFKRTDGLLMALSCWPLMWKLRRRLGYRLIDAHFGYPDGYAATLLGCWLRVPVAVTLRGKEARQSEMALRGLLAAAVQRADLVIAVSCALRDLAVSLGANPARTQVIGNGVDLARFRPVPQAEARRLLGLPEAAKVLISVGGLVEGKGFHRIIARLPALMRRFPDLHYLVVGGGTPAGDLSAELCQQALELGLEHRVHFMGAIPPDRLSMLYSAADVFVLATRYEGWANVFLEAMACGLPVVSTQVGGNAQVVTSERVGLLVPFDDPEALETALIRGLDHPWDRAAIRAYAEANGWENRMNTLVPALTALIEQQAVLEET